MIKKWLKSFLTEDMFQQVKEVQRIAILGFILFAVVLIFLWQYKIEISYDGKKVPVSIIELLIEKR